MAIAIDFGTSNTVITRISKITGETEIIKLGNIAQNNPKTPPLIPSLVYVNNALEENIIIGQKVRNKGLDVNNNPRYFRNFKRGIGTEIQGFLPQLEGKNISFENIGRWFLMGILRELKETPDSLILTVPIDSFENYRHWLTGICEQWNIESN